MPASRGERKERERTRGSLRDEDEEWSRAYADDMAVTQDRM